MVFFPRRQAHPRLTTKTPFGHSHVYQDHCSRHGKNPPQFTISCKIPCKLEVSRRHTPSIASTPGVSALPLPRLTSTPAASARRHLHSPVSSLAASARRVAHRLRPSPPVAASPAPAPRLLSSHLKQDLEGGHEAARPPHRPRPPPLPLHPSPQTLLLSLQTSNSDRRLSVFLSDLPRALNYGLLDLYWSLPAADSRIPASSDPDHPAPRTRPPYPNNPLIKQYSAEYWLLASLRPDSASANSSVRVVADWREADVVFVPFFATLSAEMELGWGAKGVFRRKEGNDDYRRQRCGQQSVVFIS